MRQKFEKDDEDFNKSEEYGQSFQPRGAFDIKNGQICPKGFIWNGAMLCHQSECYLNKNKQNICKNTPYKCVDNTDGYETTKKCHYRYQFKCSVLIKRLYSCDICGKSFSLKNTFISHKMAHKKEKKSDDKRTCEFPPSSVKRKLPKEQSPITIVLRPRPYKIMTRSASTQNKRKSLPAKMRDGHGHCMVCLPVTATAARTDTYARAARKSLPAKLTNTTKNTKITLSRASSASQAVPPKKLSRKSLPAKINRTIKQLSASKQNRKSLPPMDFPSRVEKSTPRKTATTRDNTRNAPNLSKSQKKITHIDKKLSPPKISVNKKTSKHATQNRKSKEILLKKSGRSETQSKRVKASKIVKTLLPSKRSKTGTNSIKKCPSFSAKEIQLKKSGRSETQSKRAKASKIVKTPLPSKPSKTGTNSTKKCPSFSDKEIQLKKSGRSESQIKRVKASKIVKSPLPSKASKTGTNSTKKSPSFSAKEIQLKKSGRSETQSKRAEASKIVKTPLPSERSKTGTNTTKKCPSFSDKEIQLKRSGKSETQSKRVKASKIVKTPLPSKRSKTGTNSTNNCPLYSAKKQLDRSVSHTFSNKSATVCSTSPISQPDKSRKSQNSKTPKVAKVSQLSSQMTKVPKVLNPSKTPTTSKSLKLKDEEVKNPFIKTLATNNKSRKSEPILRRNINQMIKNPRTIKERKLNNEILSDFHADHSDDMFSSVAAPAFVSRLHLLDSPHSTSPILKTKSKTPLASLVNNFEGWSADTPGYLKSTAGEGITPKQAPEGDFEHLAFVQKAIKNRRVQAIKRKSLFPQPRSRSLDSLVGELQPALKKFRSDPPEEHDPEDEIVEPYFDDDDEKENDSYDVDSM